MEYKIENKLEHCLESLYQFMKGKCSDKNHDELAIYFCNNIECKDKYICSECLMDNPSHLTSHKKFFVRLNNKNNFLSAFDLKKLDEVNKNSKNTNNESDFKEEIVNFYQKLKEYIIEEIDQHLKNNIDNYVNIYEKEDRGENNGLNVKNNICDTINEFINKNNKDAFTDLLIKLNHNTDNKICKDKSIKEFELHKEIINMEIKEIIEANLRYNYPNLVPDNSKVNELKFSFAPDMKNSRNNFPIKESIQENKPQFQTFRETPSKDILNSFYEESCPNKESIDRSANIKTRLEGLKQKFKNIK